MNSTTDATGTRSSAANLLERIAQHPPLELDRDELAVLIDAAEVIRQADTCLAGPIRILEIDDVVMVQEQTQRGRILVRRIDTVDAASALVDDRLATYERMWDGCGCRVDYGRRP